MTVDSGWYGVNPASLDGSSHLLLEIATLLHQGRPDADLSVQARRPRAHWEVGVAVEHFAYETRTQYDNAVALIAALSTKLRAAKGAYAEADAATKAALDAIVLHGKHVPAHERPQL
ncbi:hypothetical protein [Streptomyces sp. NPDC048057]|uniref:hypothetical protein n=1 Tax=Streptomyces sp. NPDC048057 TaxID=3155628 RepID=UPI0033D63FD1